MQEQSDEPLMDVETLQAYVDTVDLAEAAALGQASVVAFFVAMDADPPRFASAILGWLAGCMKLLAMSQGLTIQEMATALRADGAR